MVFPFDIENDEIELEVEEEKEPADYEIDFATGKLTGRIITGLDAIKQWVRLALSTDRYYFTQYSWDYGCELNRLIGQGYDAAYIKTEARRMIEETLTAHDDITGISDFECELVKDKLYITFWMETTYGGVEINV